MGGFYGDYHCQTLRTGLQHRFADPKGVERGGTFIRQVIENGYNRNVLFATGESKGYGVSDSEEDESGGDRTEVASRIQGTRKI